MAWHIYAQFDSSNIAAIKYEDSLQILEVTFKNGGVYQYYDVPAQVSKDFENAPSKGVFLAGSIKGHYRYSKV
ncbi:KTSC domain-containing protein [Asticcacaulis sp. 201]|uniref:KTSC domain-containing protein n=1 Tax=Asticcacaulis sp. 201 TaxID=3028787 RepID=UPI003983B316